MENENQPTVPSGSTEAEEQFAWMRRQMVTVLILLIVVVAALDIFLLRQVQYSRMDMRTLRTTVDEYQKTNGAPVEYFLQRTFSYAEMHEEFRPVLAKYGLIIVSNPPAAKPATAPSPIPPAPRK